MENEKSGEPSIYAQLFSLRKVKQVYSYFSSVIENRFSNIAHLSGWTPFGMTPAMLRSENGALNVINQAAALAAGHPSGMSYFWANGNYIVVTSEVVLKQVLKTEGHSLVRADNSPIAHYAGQAMFFSPTNDRWIESRKIWKQHLFDGKNLQQYHTQMKICLKDKLNKIVTLQGSKKEIDLQDFITDIVIEIAQKSLLKNKVDLKEVSERWKIFTDDAHWLIGTARGQLEIKLQSYIAKFNINTKFQTLLKYIRDLEKDVFDDHQKNNTGETTIIDDLDALSKKTLNPNMVLNEIGFILEALHENTIKAFCIIIKLLNKYPDVEQKLREELALTLGEDIDEWTYEQIGDLKYLDCIFKEALRLFTPAPVYLRTVEEPFKLGNIETQKGDIILIPASYIHRMKCYWGDDADEFKPERFNESKKYDPYSYMPFSEGSRKCIGRNFALHEIKLILACLYRKHRLVVEDDNDFSLTWKILLAFDKPTKIRVEMVDSVKNRNMPKFHQ